MKRSPSRADFVKTSAAVAAGTIVGFPAFIPKRSAAADMLTLGVSEELTGVYAYPAKNEVRGMQMAVDARNAHGGVLGRQVRMIVEDNQNNPGVAVEKARKLIQVDQVDALIGTVNSAVSQATSNVASRRRSPSSTPADTATRDRRAVPMDDLPHLPQHLDGNARDRTFDRKEVRQEVVLHHPRLRVRARARGRL